jgi:eight-cysteine-cluster-containing protein
MQTLLRSPALALPLALTLTACTAEKTPFDDPALDDELGGEGKADYFTNRAVIRGTIAHDVAIEDQFIADKYAGYTFIGETGLKIDLALDATDGYSDPVLLLYGPRRANGTWPRRIAANDDAVGLDSRISGFALPADGTYLVLAGEYWGDSGSFRLLLDLPGIDCFDELTVSPTDPHFGRFEGTGYDNACQTDADCGTGGCSGEVCAADDQTIYTTCEAIIGPAGGCQCVDNQCQWAETFCPHEMPGVGQGCGPAGLCAEGLTCMTYCGISCAFQFSTCEISCLDGNPCPDGLVCMTIYDGPGTVCRPGPSSECPVEECGPAMGMPNTLCPDGVTVAGPTGRCLRHLDNSCGWEVISCPE